MEQVAQASLVAPYDGAFRQIQKRVAEPAITISLKNHHGLAALSGVDEVRVCEAYMAGHLDVSGEVLEVHNDRHNYVLTCKICAENLDAAREEIVSRWGEALYRRFRLYLWGSAQAFHSCGMDAYRVVLELPDEEASAADRHDFINAYEAIG